MRNHLRRICIAVTTGIIAVVASSAVGSECLRYDEIVKVTGELNAETHAGPPNYTSIAKGDAPEKIWVLRTDNEVCTVASGQINRLVWRICG